MQMMPIFIMALLTRMGSIVAATHNTKCEPEIFDADEFLDYDDRLDDLLDVMAT
jgi:hypothetical protein